MRKQDLELVTILLDWEKAFHKIHQGRLLDALKRICIPIKVVRVIEAIYRSPKFSVKEMGEISSERRQNSGIRQGCPLSSYLFITVMTVMVKDMNSNLSQEEILYLETNSQWEWKDTISFCTQTTPLFSLAIGKLRKSYFIKYKRVK